MRGCGRAILVALLLCGFVATTGFAGDGDHLVLFKDNRVPSNFKLAVQNLGGRVTYTHKVGIAIVAGLTDAAAAALAKRNDVAQVERDESFQLEEPVGNGVQLAFGSEVASADDPASARHFWLQWNMVRPERTRPWGWGRCCIRPTGASPAAVSAERRVAGSGVEARSSVLSGASKALAGP